jgi:hypothetical protein
MTAERMKSGKQVETEINENPNTMYGNINTQGKRIVLTHMPDQSEYKIKRILTAPIDTIGGPEEDSNPYDSYMGKRKRDTVGIRVDFREPQGALRRQRRYGRIIKAMIPHGDNGGFDDDDEEEDEEVIEYFESPEETDVLPDEQPHTPYVQYVPMKAPSRGHKSKPKQKVAVQLQLPPELVQAMHEAKRLREKPPKQMVQIIEVERKVEPPPPPPTTQAPTTVATAAPAITAAAAAEVATTTAAPKKLPGRRRRAAHFRARRVF